MQVDTGHLVTPERLTEARDKIERLRREYEEAREKPEKFETVEDVKTELKAFEEQQKEMEKYIEVPAELNRAAKRKLAGKEEATVSLTSGGNLSRWAASQRKAKRKSAAQSRRGNR